MVVVVVMVKRPVAGEPPGGVVIVPWAAVDLAATSARASAASARVSKFSSRTTRMSLEPVDPVQPR